MGNHCGQQGWLLRGAPEGKRLKRAGQEGFTLAEVITALALLGVAGYISVSLFGLSHDLAQANSNQNVAAQLAREQLNRLTSHPVQYGWPELDDLEPGSFGPVELDRATGQGFQPPSATPSLRRPTEAMRNAYENFTWEAYARITETGSPFAEVAVVVRWKDKARLKTFTLTSAIPRAALEAKQ